MGQTAQVYIGSVPHYGYENSPINNGVTCQLWDTDYANGKFNYKFTNTSSQAKTIDFVFDVLISTPSTTYHTNIVFRMTVQPVVIPPQPVEISGLVTYPLKRNLTYINNQPFGTPFENYPIGIKLPEENLNLKWDQTKLNTSDIYISLFNHSQTTPITKIKVSNTGSYSLNVSSLGLNIYNSSYYNSSYYMKIENLSGSQYGTSGTFRLLHDHLPLFSGSFPSAYPNANWIFVPDSSGSYSGLYTFWFPDRINASNVIIDLYDSNGNFFKRLSNSTPNTGAFYYPSDDNIIPRNSRAFYQYKITSVENPAKFGYSEVFHWWYD